ncbi:MAG: hypothetical protein K2M06_09170 [Muribaculaceae bacterium]|nr:hypothetical protein [Muribaculaceae bacterium]
MSKKISHATIEAAGEILSVQDYPGGIRHRQQRHRAISARKASESGQRRFLRPGDSCTFRGVRRDRRAVRRARRAQKVLGKAFFHRQATGGIKDFDKVMN